MKHKIAGGLLTLAGLCTGMHASAASLQMYPVTVNFCKGASVAAVYVKNTGEENIGAQLRVYQWQQQNHQDLMNPTSELVVSPPITSIPPGKEQLVRVISPAPIASGGPEKSYRLLIDELPQNSAAHSSEQVHFLLRYSVPVFFSCPEQKPDLSAIHASLDSASNRRRLVIRNSGVTHIKLSRVSIESGGKSYLISKGLFGYVLPGSEMTWDLPNSVPAGTSLTATLGNNATSQTIPLTRQ
ncbi:molecular chaperone [Pluralibacter gergoviae]|uniref:fimbrial biogenesis chaperone n=1 Tax=Pluralibacter gergoviae TaxID=61647 RepID=UPI0004F68588|nr:molecular chaperone [Pluralibacter gergoviae]